MEYQGKTVVVTGAGSGLGAAMADVFAAAGARLALLDIDSVRAEAKAAELRKYLEGVYNASGRKEDLSKLVGDIAAHRIVDTARHGHEWRQDATQRLTENVAEYLTEEKRAFITADDLETLARENETLRDDLARLDARINKLTSALQKT